MNGSAGLRYSASNHLSEQTLRPQPRDVAHLCVEARVLIGVADVDGQPGGRHQLGDAVVDEPVGVRRLLHAVFEAGGGQSKGGQGEPVSLLGNLSTSHLFNTREKKLLFRFTAELPACKRPFLFLPSDSSFTPTRT